MSKENALDDDDANTINSLTKHNMEPKVVGIYRQDIVTCNKNSETSMVGIVTQVAGDTDSDTDTSDDEDDFNSGDDASQNADHRDDDGELKINDYGEKNDPLSTDQVRVVWMDHSETTLNAGEVTVIDRAFMHGDIVAAASDPTGQVGVVEDVSISVDLLTFNGNIVKGISSRDLKRVREFSVGDYVVLGPWLGRVDDVLDNVTVLFDDGSMCKVSKADPFRLKPVSKSFAEDGHFPYYPGQRVRASSSSVFKNARWISGLWKANRMEGTVAAVTVGSVYIYWIASAGYGPECANTPAEEQSPKNLKLLSCFTHSYWQVGDWCFLPSHAVSSDNPIDKSSFKVKCDGCTSEDPEGDRDVEGALLEQSAENHPSHENIASTELDMLPKLDRHTGNVKTNTYQDSKSCSSSLSVPKEPAHDNRPLHRKKLRKVLVRRDKKARKKDENFERALLIVNTVTMVDVIWQDGKRENGISSPDLIPIDNPGDQEFVSEQYVVEKVTEEEDDFSAVRRVGVVKSVNAKERTARVRWLKQVSRPEDPREFDNEEVVSVYELETHPDFTYCYGDVVVRLTPVSTHLDIDDSTDLVEESNDQLDSEESKLGADSKCEKQEDTANSELYADFSDLSWVGNISGLKDGDIEVTWADGMVSTVGPQAIYVVGRDDDEESVGAESEMSDDDDDAASWETVHEGEMDAVENTEEESGSQNFNSVTAGEDNTEVSEESNSVRNGPLSIPLAALGFSTRLLTGFFSWGKKQIDPLISEHNSENGSHSLVSVDESERTKSTSEYTSQGSNATDGDSSFCENEEQDRSVSDVTYNRMVLETISELKSEEDDADSMKQSYYLNSSSNFKHFDTAKDPLDHFFLGANDQSNTGRKWLKKVQQDWGILQKNLPDSIYVRVYEDRMDLLRAVIVGAYGTPYQDGLFVFDFHLPPDYPQVPPTAHYHSGGWRINPNLYEEGKVCLSLLNTWSGRGNEVWDPCSSSILQVLVSLQGLVLNSKPYFNEAGYDKQVGTAEGEKNSLSYNENTFLLNCKSVMLLLRKPPKDFEELIKDHFRRRGYYLLKACDAYMKGYLIGSLGEDACVTDKSGENSTSVGFKLMLARILPKLITSLGDVGADVENFKHLLQ